jgi:hypothetical protein
MRHKPRLKSFVTLSAALAACLHFSAAGLSAQQAYQVDEAVNPRCDLSEVPEITDPPRPLFKALAENGEATATIIVYGLPGEARRYAERVKRWLSDSRGIDPKRLAAVYGGSSGVMKLELWITPPGAILPQLYKAEGRTKAALFDRYGYLDGELCESGRPAALAGFAEALKERPAWRGYIVVRPHRNKRGLKRQDDDWDDDGNVTPREAQRRAAQDKRLLVRKFGLAPTRLKALAGGEDAWTHAELWLVPPGAEPPPIQTKSQAR